MSGFSKYKIFTEVVNLGSFTKTAEKIGYSQSAISQMVKNIETDMGVCLLERHKDGLSLTKDGQQLWPHIQAIVYAEDALEQKRRELTGLENSTIKIGAFTSVSRNLLPELMRKFKEIYPKVNFFIKQGDYNEISSWVQDGSVDFGFSGREVTVGFSQHTLYEDHLLAVLPLEHPLAVKKEVSLADLAEETFILLDEGEESTIMRAFNKAKLNIRPAYIIYDDYTILAMVRQNLGISILFEQVVAGYEKGLVLRPIKEKPFRRLDLIWKKKEILPTAARNFMSFILEQSQKK